MDHDGESKFRSRIPPPKQKSDSATLAEVSESTQNARAKPSMAPPEHSTTGQKRKALADPTVEYTRPAPSAPDSRLPGKIIKAGSIQDFSKQSSTASSRSASAASSRNASNGSNHSRSHGGSRNQQLPRPNSSRSLYQQNPRIPKSDQHRPASSFDTTGQKGLDSNGQDINSMRTFLSSSHSTVRNKNPPKYNSAPAPVAAAAAAVTNTLQNVSESSAIDRKSVKRAQSLRDISISTRLGTLSLSDAQAFQPKKDDKEVEVFADHLPKTPASQIPKKIKRVVLEIPTPTRSRRSLSPTKTPRKRAPPVCGYMTIESNIKRADFDVNDRLDKMETMYSDMKATLNGSTSERDNLKETMALLIARSLQSLPGQKRFQADD